MKTVKIEKSIDINASREKVWRVLTKDEYTSKWYEPFSEGSKVETDWQEGSKAIFTDNSGSGLAATIVISKPPEELVVEYTGLVVKGMEDYESEAAKGVKGGREIYRLSEQSGTTHLATESDMSEEMYNMMAAAWDKAIVIIKELSEKN